MIWFNFTRVFNDNQLTLHSATSYLATLSNLSRATKSQQLATAQMVTLVTYPDINPWELVHSTCYRRGLNGIKQVILMIIKTKSPIMNHFHPDENQGRGDEGGGVEGMRAEKKALEKRDFASNSGLRPGGF
jgi:hypothetical protein